MAWGRYQRRTHDKIGVALVVCGSSTHRLTEGTATLAFTKTADAVKLDIVQRMNKGKLFFSCCDDRDEGLGTLHELV